LRGAISEAGFRAPLTPNVIRVQISACILHKEQIFNANQDTTRWN
jgi:hypothetical protein